MSGEKLVIIFALVYGFILSSPVILSVLIWIWVKCQHPASPKKEE